jgi:hypothetical protein
MPADSRRAGFQGLRVNESLVAREHSPLEIRKTGGRWQVARFTGAKRRKSLLPEK